MTSSVKPPPKAISLERLEAVDSVRSSSEGNDLAYRSGIGEAIKPGIDVVKLDRAAFKPVDR